MEVAIDFVGVGQFSREWLEENPQAAQELLKRCKGQYPQCLCRTPGVPLYIACRTHYYLARLPNSGPQHAAFCPSYEPDPTLCGLGIYSPRALAMGHDGQVSVRLEVPLLIRSGVTGEPAGAVEPPVPQELRETLGLTGLLHLLFEHAGFNRWVPKMQGRRRYRQLYRYLDEAAQCILVQRKRLNQHLFIPEPYVPEEARSIEARRQERFRELTRTRSGNAQRFLVLARWRTARITDEIIRIQLSQLPREFEICASAQSVHSLRRRADFAFVDWPQLHPTFRLILLLTLQRSPEGEWRSEHLTGLVTTQEYVPVLSMADALLSDRLVQEQRAFYKPLSYDSQPHRYPNFLLTDVGDHTLSLEILSDSDELEAPRIQRMAHYHDTAAPFWCWKLSRDALPPPLPPSVTRLGRAGSDVTPSVPTPIINAPIT